MPPEEADTEVSLEETRTNASGGLGKAQGDKNSLTGGMTKSRYTDRAGYWKAMVIRKVAASWQSVVSILWKSLGDDWEYGHNK